MQSEACARCTCSDWSAFSPRRVLGVHTQIILTANPEAEAHGNFLPVNYRKFPGAEDNEERQQCK